MVEHELQNFQSVVQMITPAGETPETGFMNFTFEFGNDIVAQEPNHLYVLCRHLDRSQNKRLVQDSGVLSSEIPSSPHRQCDCCGKGRIMQDSSAS